MATYEMFPGQEAIQSAPTYGTQPTAPTSGGGTFEQQKSKVDSAMAARDRKMAKFDQRAGYAPTDMQENTYVDLEDGYTESMANKIMNTQTPEEISDLTRQANNEYGVVNTNQGLMRQDAEGNFIPVEEPAENFMSLYRFRTKDGGEKWGIWAGLNPKDRFSDKYKTPGAPEEDLGVDPEQLLEHYILPAHVARTLEAYRHGSTYSLADRTIRREIGDYSPEFEAEKARYGSGYTEHYKGSERVPEEFDPVENWNNFKERFRLDNGGRLTREEERIMLRQAGREREADRMDWLDRTWNTVKGGLSSASRELLMDFVDIVYDVGDSEEKKRKSDDFWSYNDVHSSRAHAEVQSQVKEAYQHYLDTGDLDLGKAMGAVMSSVSPEFLVESIAGTMVMLIGLPKKVGLKGIGEIQKQLKAGNITPAAAKEAVKTLKSDQNALQTLGRYASDNLGYLMVTAGNVNDSVEEFKNNNNGEIAFTDYLRITGVEALISGMDRLSFTTVASGVPGAKYFMDMAEDTKKAVDNMTPSQLQRAYNGAKGVVEFGAKTGVEAATEYGQSMLETISTKYGSADYDMSLGELLTDFDTQVDAWTGAASGAGMGGTMAGISPAASLLGAGYNSVAAGLGRVADRTQTSQESDAGAEDEVSAEVKAADRTAFNDTINKLSELSKNNQLSAETLSDHIRDLAKLRSVRYAVSDAAPEALAAADARIVELETAVSNIVVNHHDGAITLNDLIEQATEAASTTEETVLGSAPSSGTTKATSRKRRGLSDQAKEAFVTAIVDIVARNAAGKVSAEVEKKLNTFATTNKVPESRVASIIKSWASVDQEATTEARGVEGRARNLRLELASGAPNRNSIRRQYNEAVKWRGTTVNSISQLEQGLRDADNLAATLNRDVRRKDGKRGTQETITTEYMRDSQSKSGGGKYTIDVTFYDGKWSIPPKQRANTTKLIKAKKETVKGQDNLLGIFHQEATKYLDKKSIIDFGEYRIDTNTTGKETPKQVLDEVEYVASVKKAISSVTGTATRVNKVIRGKAGKKDHWRPESSRAKTNSPITNLKSLGKDYEASDVVYLHAPDTFKMKGVLTRTELYNRTSAAHIEAMAAIKAGATIVLSKSHEYRSGESDAAKRNRDIVKFLKGKGYIPLGVAGSNNPAAASIFVPDTEENAAILAESQEEAIINKKEKDREDNFLKRVTELAIEREAVAKGYKGRTLEEIDADIARFKEGAEEFFSAEHLLARNRKTKAAAAGKEAAVDPTADGEVATLAEESIDEDAALADTEVDVEEAAEDALDHAVDTMIVNPKNDAVANMEAHMQKTLDAAVKTVSAAMRKEAKRVAEAEGPVIPLEAFGNEALEFLADAAVKAEQDRSRLVTALLDGWKLAAKVKLVGQELIGALNESIKEFGYSVSSKTKEASDDVFLLRAEATAIMNNAVGADRTLKTYRVKTQRHRKNGTTFFHTTTKFGLDANDAVNTRRKIDSKVADEVRTNWETVESIDEVTHNPTDYLQVNPTITTPFNTVAARGLPEVIRDVMYSTRKAIKETIAPLHEREKDLKAPTSGKDELETFWTTDSPARGLLFDKEGNLQENLVLALGVATRDFLNSDRMKLIEGPKDKATIANIFGVREQEVTKEMQEFAEKGGVFLKGAASSIGKSALQSLGITRKFNDAVTRGMYESMVADLGNVALLSAQHEGLLKIDTEKSNDLATLFRDGEVWDTENVTYIVRVPSKMTKEGRKLNESTEKALKVFEEIEEMIPGVSSNKKGPFYATKAGEGGVPTQLREDMMATIRNDLTGGNVPKKAKKTLGLLMDTRFSLDMEGVGRLFEEIDGPENVARMNDYLRLQGYVEISDNNPVYTSMLFEDQQLQEAKNRDILKSLNDLRDAYNTIKDTGVNEFYFAYYQSGNHRYGEDSNTLRPQGDKNHRFVAQPATHTVTYKVDRTNNTFEAQTEKGGVDSSLYMRAAIAQAFGQGIDKMSTRGGVQADGSVLEGIIPYGNAMLSMSLEDIQNVRDSVWATGKAVVTADGVNYKIKADHIMHTLQALNLLEQLKSSDSDTITTSLTFETDALTSGFANKVQQYPILDELTEHARKVGIMRKTSDSRHINDFAEPDWGMNDHLADKGNLDSYQNLGKKTMEGVAVNKKELKDAPAALFEAVQSVLPGGDMLDPDGATVSGMVTKAVRDLFKPAFMVFNYAASINRIKLNLGEEVVDGLYRQIVKADFTDKSTPIYAAATQLASIIASKADYKKGATAEELQDRLRKEKSDRLMVLGSLTRATTVGAGGKASLSEGKPHVKLTEYLTERVIEPTYGKAVEDTFNTEFKEFIAIQDTTNDLFKQSFAVFNRMFLDKVKDFRGEGNKIVTEEDVRRWIGELREVFPVIAGPLSESLEDGIHVYDYDTRTPNEIMNTTASPAARVVVDGEVVTRGVNPLMKSIVSAVNSGSVLPFHALDGAQMASMVVEFAEAQQEYLGDIKGASILAIHDATMSPLYLTDLAAWIYNKNTVDIHKNYSIMEELVEMGQRVAEVMDKNSPKYALDGSKVERLRGLSTSKNLSIKKDEDRIKEIDKILAGGKAHGELKTKLELEKAGLVSGLTFLRDFEITQRRLSVLADSVNSAREAFRNTNTATGTMVGLSGSVYHDGGEYAKSEFSFDYLKKFVDDYRVVEVSTPSAEPSEGSDQRTEPSTPQSADNSLTDRLVLKIPEDASVEEEAALRVSTRMVAGKPVGMTRIGNKVLAANKADINAPYTADDVITVQIADKFPAGYKESRGSAKLTPAQVQKVEDAWKESVETLRTALDSGAKILFRGETGGIDVFGEDAEDAEYIAEGNTLVGEAFVYVTLVRDTTAGTNVTETVTIDGVTFNMLSRKKDGTFTPPTEETTSEEGINDSITALNETDPQMDLFADLEAVTEITRNGC